ncbi:MAG: DUF4920 domain-containing protein [Ignavibacteria bacterium]|nr:DUF4920 domain-containing protein [Ignavibacteria bacterium]
MFNLLKRITLLSLALVLMSSVAFSQDDPTMSHEKPLKSNEPVGLKTSDGMLYGQDYDVSLPVMDYGDLLKNADDNNNKVIMVRGKVADVCQAMGCWMTMTDGAITTRATTSHKFVLPKDIAGQDAVIIGTFKVTEISEEEARHYNEESKTPVANESIVGPQKVYEIDAIGIKILNPVSDSN